MIATLFGDTATLHAGVMVNPPKSQADTPRAQDADIDLVDRARAGDVDAFRELVSRYQSRAFSIAIGIVHSKEDAEDVVQEAFLKVHRNLGSFRGQSSFYTWLYRIVFNLAIDLSRRRYRRSESNIGENSKLDAVAQIAGGDASDFMSASRNPDEELRRLTIGKHIHAAIESLSPNHRAVIVLREIEGLSYAEISDVVGCSKGTVMSRLHHARKRLQRVLADFMPWGEAEAAKRLAEEGALDDDGDAADRLGLSK